MASPSRSTRGSGQPEVVEICAGAGGQSHGLERAGFDHRLAVELDPSAAATLRHNRPSWLVAEGDVASTDTWQPSDYKGVDLLAGGVPCPPFSIAGKQRGANDERDLFAWAVEQVEVVRPRALLLENVRGLSGSRFAGYRQYVLDRLADLGYVGEWKLLNACDFGVAQLRPRFVLVALQPDDARYFRWPTPLAGPPPTVGEALVDLMAENDWIHAEYWASKANAIGPTIVGGSKRHGGADLGPTRAKRAWAELHVDAMGVANEAPAKRARKSLHPRLTIEMVAKLQGFDSTEWEIVGKKTSRYRQVGNAFPPPVAEAVGKAIRDALDHEGVARSDGSVNRELHDPVLRALKSVTDFVPETDLIAVHERRISLDRHIDHLMEDFEIDVRDGRRERSYKLVGFKAFVGQSDHARHDAFTAQRSTIS